MKPIAIVPQRHRSPFMATEWQELRKQLLMQWKLINSGELDSIGPNRTLIARLIERKYGIASGLIENYLCNFERTMPLMAA